MIGREREGGAVGATGGEVKVCHIKVKKLQLVGDGRALCITRLCKMFG